MHLLSICLISHSATQLASHRHPEVPMSTHPKASAILSNRFLLVIHVLYVMSRSGDKTADS